MLQMKQVETVQSIGYDLVIGIGFSEIVWFDNVETDFSMIWHYRNWFFF